MPLKETVIDSRTTHLSNKQPVHPSIPPFLEILEQLGLNSEQVTLEGQTLVFPYRHLEDQAIAAINSTLQQLELVAVYSSRKDEDVARVWPKNA